MKKSVIIIAMLLLLAAAGLFTIFSRIKPSTRKSPPVQNVPAPAQPQPAALAPAAPATPPRVEPAQPQQRTTVTRNFEADGKQYKVTELSEDGRGKLTVEITSQVDGQPTKRVVEAPNEQVLAKNEPELYKTIKQ